MKKMSKFEIKAFECEILGEVYNNLENRKSWFAPEVAEDGEQLSDWQIEYNAKNAEKIAIIDDIMKRIEKML